MGPSWLRRYNQTSYRYRFLIVSDVEATRKDLLSRGVEISGVFHDERDVP
jgi:hypothetical protein